MRASFIRTLHGAAASDDRIVLVAGDLGFSVLEEFASAYPERYIPIGINEQGAMGVCAGLASQGLKVYYYSIVNFATLRCIEQIRNDVAYHSANVTIVGVGAGMVYGSAGYTHWAIEDLGAMMLMPRLRILTPFDPASTAAATLATLEGEGPNYLRLGKGGEPRLESLSEYAGYTALWIGADATSSLVLTHGALASTVVAAAGNANFTGTILAVTEPRNVDSLAAATERFSRVMVVEETVRTGGLGSVIEQGLLNRPRTVTYAWRGIDDALDNVSAGNHEQLRARHGLDEPSLRLALRNLDARTDFGSDT